MSDDVIRLSAAVDAEPEDASLHLRLAQALLKSGRPDESFAHIGAALLLRPEASQLSGLIVEHPEFPRYVAMAGNKTVRGEANRAARLVLGLPADEPIKIGPQGKQTYARYGRSIESVASLLKRHADVDEPQPVRLKVTLTGSGVDGGTVVVPLDHDLYETLIAMFEDGPAVTQWSQVPPGTESRQGTHDEEFDPFAGKVGEVFPPLNFMADVDLASPWLDECAKLSGHSKALAYLRSSNAKGANVGDLLAWDLGELTAAIPSVNPMLKALVLDFLANLGTRAHEIRESAMETVSSWMASTSGRATWGNIVTLGFNKKPPEVESAWRTLATMPVSDRPVPNATNVIAGFLAELGEVDRTILVEHTIAPHPRTADDIGEQFAMPARLVKDREIALDALIRSELTAAASWRPVEWACQAYRQSGAPSVHAKAEVPETNQVVARHFIAWLCASGS